MATNNCSDECDFEVENELINKEDGLGLVDELGNNEHHSELLIDSKLLESSSSAKQSDVLIITNLSGTIFNSPEKKEIFEGLVRQIEPAASFSYLSSFRRTRVQMSSDITCQQCINYLHNYRLFDTIIKCYQAPMLTNHTNAQYLELPERTNLFLLSPPCSPPVGWEGQPEREPTVNHELLAAIERLGICDSYELYSGGRDELPSIVIHVCEDPPNYEVRPPIEQTRCPQRNSAC